MLSVAKHPVPVMDSRCRVSECKQKSGMNRETKGSGRNPCSLVTGRGRLGRERGPSSCTRLFGHALLLSSCVDLCLPRGYILGSPFTLKGKISLVACPARVSPDLQCVWMSLYSQPISRQWFWGKPVHHCAGRAGHTKLRIKFRALRRWVGPCRVLGRHSWRCWLAANSPA